MTDMTRGVMVGSVFGRSVNVIRSSPVATLGIGFGLMAVPQLVLGQFGGQALFVRSLSAGVYGVVATYGLFVGLLWLIASAAIVHATVVHDQGRSSGLAENLRIGLSRCLPLLGVSLLFILAVWLGMLFLMVPGIMLAVMWSVAAPAIVAERTGVFGAFGRSRALTKGARWPVFGTLLLAFVIYLLVSIVVGVVAVAGYGSIAGVASAGATLARTTAPSLFVQLLQSVVTTMLFTWYTAVGAALFVELRRWKDGPDVDRLTDIFA